MWRLSTSLPYVNVTGPYTGIPQARFSYGFVPTLSDVLKRTPEEFTPMRTAKRVGAEKAYRKIRTSSFQEASPSHFFLSLSFSAKACNARAAFQWYYRFRVSQTWPRCKNVPFPRLVPLASEKHPFCAREESFTRQGMTAPSVVCVFASLNVRLFVRTSLLVFRGVHAGVSQLSWKYTCELSRVAQVSAIIG